MIKIITLLVTVAVVVVFFCSIMISIDSMFGKFVTFGVCVVVIKEITDNED